MNAMTPDGRYFVVKGQLWRSTNPSLSEDAAAVGQRSHASATSNESAPAGNAVASSHKRLLNHIGGKRFGTDSKTASIDRHIATI